MAPSKGRPPIDDPKNERLYIRVTPTEKAKIRDFMSEYSVSLLSLIHEGMEAVRKKESSG